MTDVMISVGDTTRVMKASPDTVLCTVIATYGNRTEEYHVKLNENGKVIFRNSQVPYTFPSGSPKGKRAIVDSSPG